MTGRDESGKFVRKERPGKSPGRFRDHNLRQARGLLARALIADGVGHDFAAQMLGCGRSTLFELLKTPSPSTDR